MKYVVGDRVKVKSGIYSGLTGTVSNIELHFIKNRRTGSKKRAYAIHVRTRNNRLLKVNPIVLKLIPDELL